MWEASSWGDSSAANGRAGWASGAPPWPDRRRDLVTTEPTDDGAEKVHQLHQEKDDQVLERESLETELMEDDRSDAGEDIEDVENE